MSANLRGGGSRERRGRPVDLAGAERRGSPILTDEAPGIRAPQVRQGLHLPRSAKGRTITDPEEIRRLTALAVPPAYTDVWICPIRTGTSRRGGAMRAAASSIANHPEFRKGPRLDEVRAPSSPFAEVLPAIREAGRRPTCEAHDSTPREGDSRRGSPARGRRLIRVRATPTTPARTRPTA